MRTDAHITQVYDVRLWAARIRAILHMESAFFTI